MFSEDVKLVFGFEPSGLLEKVIRAPGIGTPRTLLPRGLSDDESELEGVVESVLVGFAGWSVLGIFGILIFGIGNWAIAGAARNEVIAIAAIRIRDLIIKVFPLKSEVRRSSLEEFSLSLGIGVEVFQ